MADPRRSALDLERIKFNHDALDSWRLTFATDGGSHATPLPTKQPKQVRGPADSYECEQSPAPGTALAAPLADHPDLGPRPVGGLHAGQLTVPVGLIDMPALQRREPLVAELSGSRGNVAVVGGPQSGSCDLVSQRSSAEADVRSRADQGGLEPAPRSTKSSPDTATRGKSVHGR